MHRPILFLFVIGLIAGSLNAATGTDALNFLKIKPSARGASIGDGFVAIANDSSAVFYNPAGLSQINDMQFSLMHMLYMADTSYEYVSFAMPFGQDISIGASIVYLNYGAIDKTTEDTSGIFSATTGSYSPSDMAIALSGSCKLGEDMSVGLTAKYATETIDTVSISGVMFDAGLLTSVEGIKVGAALYNLGSVSTDKAPMYFRVGGSTKFQAMEAEDLTAALGVNYVLASSKISVGLGGEWKYSNFLFVRGSYSLMTDADSLNLGIGFKQDLGGFVGEVAYNFGLLGDLGASHRISVGVKLGDDDDGYKKGKKKAQSKSTPAKTDNNNSKSKSTLKYYFKKK